MQTDSGDVDDGQANAHSDGEPPVWTVLVLDDDEAVGRAHTRILLSSGLRAQLLTSAWQALERISGGERFDVVLCDMRMPLMSGVEFFRRAQAVWPELNDRILFISGAPAPEDAEYVSRHRLPLLWKPTGAVALVSEVSRRASAAMAAHGRMPVAPDLGGP